MSDKIGDMSYDEVVNLAAESVMRKLLTGDFKSMRELVYNAVDVSIRWGIEHEKRRESESKSSS